jgi:hypothetical protein
LSGQNVYRLTTSENLDYDVDINIAKETIRENIKISPKESLGSYELKQQKSWFYEECSKCYRKENKTNSNGYRIQAKTLGLPEQHKS